MSYLFIRFEKKYDILIFDVWKGYKHYSLMFMFKILTLKPFYFQHSFLITK